MICGWGVLGGGRPFPRGLEVGAHREGGEGERRAPEPPGATGCSPSGAGERHTGAYPCSAVADIALGRWNGLGRNGRDLNGDGGLRGLGRRCVRLPVGCHAPYNPAFHPRRDVALEARGRTRAEMEEMGEPTTAGICTVRAEYKVKP